MRKKITFIIFALFIFLIVFFSIFGTKIRDYYSPHVEVMAPIMYTFSDGALTFTALANTCFSTNEDGETTTYIVEEKNDTGEKAYYAKKIEIVLGKSDLNCSEIVKSPIFDALFISHTDRKLNDGIRVVIEKIANMP